MPMVSALARSINSIPVIMSVEMGGKAVNAAKAGRAKIIAMGREMGLTHPLADSTSLPIGAAEVTPIDMASGYAVFANGGRKAPAYAAWEVRNSQGELIYRHDRDAPQPQVLASRVVQDMNFMMNKVVEEGTGKRAMLDGIRAAGKTGTTNAYRDAWFVGFTGNLVASVWYGNDDHSAMNNMTGGTLPAMTWKEVMGPAHHNMELRPIPGVEPEKGSAASASAQNGAGQGQPASQAMMTGTLSRRSYDVLDDLGDLFRDAGTGSVRTSASPAGGKVAMP
jgi:penicillin-binding protein 1A